MRVCVYMLIPPCVYVGVHAYPPVCVCTFLGPARELTGVEKTPASVAEETDIDAEDVVQVPIAEDLNLNRGVTDLDATAKTPDLNQSENKVNHTCRCSVRNYLSQGSRSTATNNVKSHTLYTMEVKFLMKGSLKLAK